MIKFSDYKKDSTLDLTWRDLIDNCSLFDCEERKFGRYLDDSIIRTVEEISDQLEKARINRVKRGTERTYNYYDDSSYWVTSFTNTSTLGNF